TIRTMLDLRSCPPVLPRRFNPAVPHALEAIATRCLAYSPADRYSNATALAEDLECFLDRRDLQHASNPSIRERTRNWVSRHRKVLLAASLVIGIAGAATARPLGKLLIPVERSSAFLTAIRDIDASRFRDAVRPLETMVEDSPNSPVARFYLAIARQDTDLDGASTELTEAIKNKAALVEWGKTHPKVVEQLESLGMALFNENHRELAGSAFLTTLELDASRQIARQGAADFHEFMRRYPESYKILSGLIKEAEGHLNDKNRNYLAVWYPMRARTAVRLGEYLPSYPNPDAKSTTGSARDHFLSALNDLERGQTYLGEIHDKRAFLAQAVRVEALIALGALDANESRLVASREHFQEARRVFEKIVPDTEKQKEERESLKRKIEGTERLVQNLAVHTSN
ncbi:serine/threonine-protein kinase, partial [Singulisphaera rosea]